METVEILKQNLAIEPDLQSFIDFVLKSVSTLGGNVFAASIALLGLLEKLRQDGATLGCPTTVRLLLHDRSLFAQWGKLEQVKIVTLHELPPTEVVEELRSILENSLALVDPEILLQRNLEMMRHFNESRAKTERELEILQLSLEQHQNELLETMRQAETDALTGLFNRRAFDIKLKQIFLHTMRQKDSPLSLLFFDLDYFKEINDKFGHQFGDSYLQKMADTLREVIRENVDFAFRFGGDEFAVVIFADYPLACDKANQVLKLMENKVSIGITAINHDTRDGLTLEEYIRHADDALYEAKHRGRGQVVVDVCDSSQSNNFLPSCPDNKFQPAVNRNPESCPK